MKKLDAILEDIERYLDPLKTRQRQGTSGMLSFAYNLSFTKKNEEELKRFNQKLDRVRSDLHLANDTFKMNFSRKSKSSNDLVIMNYGEQELESVKSVATKLTFSGVLSRQIYLLVVWIIFG